MAALTGKLVADFSSFKTAVDEVQAKLTSFKTGAGDVEKSLNRMADSLSGKTVIQNATLMAEAIEQLGGVSKLTEAELVRMGSQATEAIAKMKAIGIKDIPPNLEAVAKASKDVTTETNSVTVSVGNMVKAYLSAEAVLAAIKGAFTTLTGFVADSVQAAIEAENAHKKLGAALLAQGTNVPSVSSAYEAYATALQQTTIYQDDAIEGAEALLVQVGNVMPRDMQRALQATTNLASGLGIDLTSATNLVAKAAEGNVTALKKSGIVIDEATAKSGDFGKVLDAINAKFGGQAATAAGTYQGRLLSLANTWNNLQESVGRAITTNQTVITLIDQVNRAIEGNTGELTHNQAVTNLLSDAVIFLVKAVQSQVPAVQGAILGFTGLRIAADFVVASVLNIGVSFGDAALAFAKYTKYINPVAWTQTWKDAVAEIGKGRDALAKKSESWTADIDQAIATNTEWSNALHTVDTGLTSVITALEATRGKTVETTAAGKENTGVWQQHTKAVLTDAEAQKAAAKVLTEIREKIETNNTKLDESMHRSNSAELIAIKAWRDLYAAMQLTEESIPQTVAGFYMMADGLDKLGRKSTEIDDLKVKLEILARTSLKLAEGIKPPVEGFYTMAAGLENLGLKSTEIDELKVKLENLSKTVPQVFRESFEQLPAIMQRAFEGGGGALGAAQAFGAKLADEMIASYTDRMKKAGTPLTGRQSQAIGAGAGGAGFVGGLFGGGAGATVGSLASSVGGTALAAAGMNAATIGGAIGLGAATMGIGAAAAGLVVLAQHLLSVSQAEKDARAAWNDLQKDYGSLDDTIRGVGAAYAMVGKTGVEAQRDLKAALDATHVSADAEKKALEPINAVLVQAKQRAADVADAVEKLGPAFNSMVAAAGRSKQALSDLGQQAVVTFAAQIAGGKSVTETLKTMGPSLATIAQGYKDLGLDVENVALQHLLMQNAIATSNPQLMDAVSGLSTEMDALSKMGVLNVETFQAMERTGADMFQKLQAEAAAAGGTTKDALIPMQAYLHEAAQNAKALGIPLDDNTQMLIDQSKELGVWKDVGKDATQALTDSMSDLVTKVGELIDRLSGPGGVVDAINAIPKSVDIAVNANYTPPSGLSQGGVVQAPGFASGGVTPEVASWGTPSGTDTVRAWLTPGERVLTVRDTKTFDAHGGVAALRSGSNVINFQEFIDAQRATRKEVAGLRVDMSTSWPASMARVLRDHVAQGGRRR